MSDFDDFIDGFYPYRRESRSYREIPEQPRDRDEVLAEITPAGESVLASIVALTALGQAANVLTKTGHRAAGQDRQEIAFPV